MDTINKEKADAIIKQLIELESLRDNDDDKYYFEQTALEEQFEKIPGHEHYRHDRQKTVPNSYLFMYTNYLIDCYGNCDEDKYVMKLSPEIVKIILEDYYNNGSLFRMDVMLIYINGWEKSLLKDTCPRSHIWDRIIEYMDEHFFQDND